MWEEKRRASEKKEEETNRHTYTVWLVTTKNASAKYHPFSMELPLLTKNHTHTKYAERVNFDPI